jgi:starch synthase
MAAAVRLADAVNTVSPSYAEDIQRPSNPVSGFYGGEGLENDLREAAGEGRLHGILNGCTYPERKSPPSWGDVLALMAEHRSLLGNSGHARERLAGLAARRPATVLLNIGRTVEQKVALLLEPAAGRATALEAILDELEGGTGDDPDDGVFIMLGSGEAALEARLAALAARRERFIYLRGYAERLSEPLYQACDLFLMPSSFEPCGISQMLAMRAGMPCVVHGVGGLRDTVEDGVTGFMFGGASPAEQAEAFVAATRRALTLKRKAPGQWRSMGERAGRQRFDWDLAAAEYSRLYGKQADDHES